MGYWVGLCRKCVEKQICRRSDFISSATHEIWSSFPLWSFLLWTFFLLFIFRNLTWMTQIFFSWQFEDVTAIQPTCAGEKRQPPFQAPPLWATLRAQNPKQHTVSPHLVLCHFSAFSSFWEWIYIYLTLTLGNFYYDSHDLWKCQLVMSGTFSCKCEISRMESIVSFSM